LQGYHAARVQDLTRLREIIMQDHNAASSGSGFKSMSQRADEQGSSGESRSAANRRDRQAAGDGISELQSLLEDHVRANPMRALGWAAAAGVLVGLWAAR
jgi:ElaB/YqjD/DUF883 family membrane-anchored ribosome-binding protein